jgi:hypothetical protein
LNVDRLNAEELRASMRLALDVVTAHRIARGLSLDLERMTAIRGLLEERVTQALEATDESAMPLNWSWQQAAAHLSMQIALAIVHEQKNEPPAPHEGPSTLGDT